MGWNRWNGDEILKTVVQGSTKAVRKTCNVVLTASQNEVPLDEGFLLRSGIVIIRYRKNPVGIISYGGGPGTGNPKIPYALRWHENMANFQRGRKWKYLIDPFNRLAGPSLLTFLYQEVGAKL